MLSKEANELLTKIGPGTPMGRMLRQYWVPALRAARLEADGAPVRVRLFGENFVAFRASDGRVGFLDEGCPHRGVSLALARNEDCALRCIFHGWKIDVSGRVVETPSEPEGSNLASKVKVKHYPVREVGGLIWVWLGEGEQPPQFPAFEFASLPVENMVVRCAIQNCNWVQPLEGLLDSSHVSSLHKAWLPQGAKVMDGAFGGVMGSLAPRYEVVERPYGFTAIAKRSLPDGTSVNRYTEYILPIYCFIPSTLPTIRVMSCGVPIDDEHTCFWYINWDMAGPLDAERNDKLANIGQLGPDPDDVYQPKPGPDKIWGQDRELMKQGYYAGYRALPFEDVAIQDSQGPIADRTKEHLGSSDVATIRMRRLLLDQVQSFQEGKTPLGLDQEIDYEKILAVHEIVPAQPEPDKMLA